MTQEPHDMQAPAGATVQLPCSAQGKRVGKPQNVSKGRAPGWEVFSQPGAYLLDQPCTYMF